MTMEFFLQCQFYYETWANFMSEFFSDITELLA